MRDGQASQTARRVAAQRRHVARVPADYGDPIADQRLHDDVAGELVYLDTPFTAYLAARTRFFDLAVVDAIAAGIGQVVVVGAGYDGRSLRYSAAQVQWFELDHPATVADRSARLGRLGLTSTAVAVPAEFSVDDVGARLAAAGHDAGRASQLICEGVTPYLDRDVVVRLLRALRARAAAGSRLAIDFALVPEGWRARRSRARLRARVAAHGEPFRFEVPAAGLGALMRESGWHVQSVTQPTALVLAAPYP